MCKKIQVNPKSALLILMLNFAMFLTFNSCSQAISKNVFIGDKQFIITTMETNKPETAVTEQVILKDSLFDNLQCHEWGFGSAVYKAIKVGENYTFEAEMLSKAEGAMTWTGMIMGDSIHGTMIWKKAGQSNLQYTFAGKTGLLSTKKEISLNGNIYKTNTMEKGKPKTAYDEEWTFEEGTLRSPSCEPYGFTKSPYKAWQQNNKITMECTFQSKENGHMDFTATIVDEKLLGKVIWVKQGQNNMEYEVTGLLKK